MKKLIIAMSVIAIASALAKSKPTSFQIRYQITPEICCKQMPFIIIMANRLYIKVRSTVTT